MKILQTRIERFQLLRDQIQREIELDQALLHEEELIADYLNRFSNIDNEYFAEFLAGIKSEWELLTPQLHQDRSKDLINLETRYEINQYLSDIKNKCDYDIDDNVNLEKILKEHNYQQTYEKHLINADQQKYQDIILMLENSIKGLQTKMQTETFIAQNVIKENFQQNSEPLKQSKTPLIEILSASSLKTDEQFNRLTTKFKAKKITVKGVVISLVFVVGLIFIFLVILAVILIR